MTALTDSADFLTRAQHALRQAREEGPTPLGQKMLRLGAGMLDSEEYLALPEAAQGDLGAMYAEAHYRVTGGLA